MEYKSYKNITSNKNQEGNTSTSPATINAINTAYCWDWSHQPYRAHM